DIPSVEALNTQARSAASVSSSATISDASLHASATPVNAVEGQPLNDVQVATFTDDDPDGQASDYTATIDWGDGGTSSGDISGSGSFIVTGSHTYAEEGTYALTVTIYDQGGASATATGPLVWHSVSDLNTARVRFGSTAGTDGKIYALGGDVAGQSVFSAKLVESCDP